MIAITLPAFMQPFFDWVELNPALGAVVILLVVVFVLWLLRKSLKFFMVGLVLLGVTILGSYYYYGPARTNEAVKRGAEHAYEHSKQFIDKALDESDEVEDGAEADPDSAATGVENPSESDE